MEKKQILRTCVMTHEKLEKKDLIRIVRDKSGNVFVDDSLKANGRGCYLKKDISVIESAKKKKILNRALNVEVSDSIYDEILEKL